jgi:cellulose synthase/poly-beta-1,6-N-acetylglucosamine synthase-like glycosyltransferase
MGEPSVAVLIATFKRPDRLAVLLDALDDGARSPLEGWRVRVVVCDNDPAGSARELCEARRERLEYVHEPRPGIAAARNALVEAAATDDVIVFIDDDEWPAAGWLEELLRAFDRYGADVVTGPVLSEYAQRPPDWLAPSFERPRQATGTQVSWPRTSNVLIRRAALEGPPLRFRDSYGLSGGSDSMLFLEMARRGATMVWADEAIVHELFPSSRTTLRWVLRRSFRLGNTHTRFDRDLDGGARVMALRAAKAVGWIITGVGRAALAGLRGDRRGLVVGAERVARGAGMAAAFGGFQFVEYRRGGRAHGG